MKWWIFLLVITMGNGIFSFSSFLFLSYNHNNQWMHWANLAVAIIMLIEFIFVAFHKKNYVRDNNE